MRNLNFGSKIFILNFWSRRKGRRGRKKIKWTSFHQYSWISEIETTWISLITPYHIYYLISFYQFDTIYLLTFVSDLIGRSCSNLFMRIWCNYIAFFKSNTMGCRIGKCIMWEFLEGTYYSTINLPYARHYNLQFVYFKPTLSKP